MNKQRFSLLEQRDMGKLIGATFAYLKIHFKDIMKVALVTGFPLIILGSTLVALGTAGYLRDHMDGADRMILLNQHYFTTNSILGLVCYLIGYVILTSSLITFIQLKHERNGDTVEMSELWSVFFSRGWLLTIQMLLVGIIIGVGFLVLLIPGIYLMVPLSLAAPVFIIEKKGNIPKHRTFLRTDQVAMVVGFRRPVRDLSHHGHSCRYH